MSANTSYAASRPSIAVADFKNATRAAWWNGGMGSEMASMLTNELGSVDRFRVVERNKLSHVIREQDLGASGRVNRRTAAKIGKLTGAHYLVMGTVSSYNEDTSSKGGGISFGGISIGGNSSKAYIAVDLRVVDTTTGEVEFVRTVEANSSGGGMKVGLHLNGVGANFGGKEKTPADKAIRACIVEITDYLACVMVDKDSCISEYKHKESRRRSKTRSAVELDE
jgi:curli biogenesis system outer membrane secretion channel CsgG